jgi:ribonuclease BN (tRNA processing enzyme)
MKIEVLGCYGNVTGSYRATSFLVNDSLLLDAGTVTEVLDDERIKKIAHVVISHTHVDHVKGLFPLVDELVMMGKEYRLELMSVGKVMEIISSNLFNNLVWPDFTVIPSENHAILSLRTIDLEQFTALGSVTIKPILMTHTVYTVGYVVKEGARGFMFTADTGPTERFWEVAKEEKGIEFIIADVSFPNRLENLARISGHMTTAILEERLTAYGLSDMPVYITHIKPLFMKEIEEEVASVKVKNLKLLVQGSEIVL